MTIVTLMMMFSNFINLISFPQKIMMMVAITKLMIKRWLSSYWVCAHRLTGRYPRCPELRLVQLDPLSSLASLSSLFSIFLSSLSSMISRHHIGHHDFNFCFTAFTIFTNFTGFMRFSPVLLV